MVLPLPQVNWRLQAFLTSNLPSHFWGMKVAAQHLTHEPSPLAVVGSSPRMPMSYLPSFLSSCIRWSKVSEKYRNSAFCL